jgi:putative ABC transport system permease protein
LERCLRIGESFDCTWVVGVVEDARRSELEEGPTMQFYVPLAQASEDLVPQALFIRSRSESSDLLGPVRREIQSAVPDLPFVEVQLLSELLAPQMQPWRMGTALLAFFGLLAMVLALVGLHGVVAHTMSRRKHELSVRLALGAQNRDIVRIALRHGLAIGLMGTAGGVLLTLLLARRLQPLLFHTSASDPVVLAGAAAIVLSSAVTASLLSGRRFRRIEPATILRSD